VFDHVTIRATDRGVSERFFDTLLPGLGLEKTYADEHFAEWGDFSIAAASPETPDTRGLHIGFAAPSRAHVDEFWRTGTEAGHRDDGPPGPRPQYRDDYYGAFLLDPDGNSIEAVHHGDMHERGAIDHLWIRVADLATARAFYEVVGDHAGFRLADDRPGHAHFAAGSGSFSLVAGPATEQVHMAFPVEDDATVEAFHRAATAAGYRDNGVPGERPAYHAGYYGAFVLDPDGNNIELVNHNRE
jgi:catechol 2,3-dioxygenase-like lactoylglutathione lyase family enzyme